MIKVVHVYLACVKNEDGSEKVFCRGVFDDGYSESKLNPLENEIGRNIVQTFMNLDNPHACGITVYPDTEKP